MATIDDFKKIELRAGEVVSAERVAGADKLLKLQVNLGSEIRQIVSGSLSRIRIQARSWGSKERFGVR